MPNTKTANYIDQNTVTLSQDEIDGIQAVIKEVTSRYDSCEAPSILKDAAVYAHEFPRRIRFTLNDFKLLEPPSALCVIRGYPIDDARIGDTPVHWKWNKTPSATLPEEILLILLGSLLGEPIGWGTQQGGRVVHDVMPIKGHENLQLGSSSNELLTWHTEDAFHPYRADYICMMCLRNPNRAATMFASINTIKIDEETRRLLLNPYFTIRPDESHMAKNKSDLRESDEQTEAAYRKISEMNNSPAKLSIFFGSPSSPYIRLDPYFMDPVENDSEAQRMLDTVVQAVEANLQDIVLEAGDICFIDNFKAVHGRRPFKARYDGKDRWLKRINVTRDLRKSRDARSDTKSRIIF